MKYYEAALQKDATYYDLNNPTEMAAKISKEVSAINRGTGEKVGNIVMSLAGGVMGFAFSFYWGWKYTLILLAGFPVLMVVGGAMGVAMEEGFVEQMKAYAQSAGYAE